MSSKSKNPLKSFVIPITATLLSFATLFFLVSIDPPTPELKETSKPFISFASNEVLENNPDFQEKITLLDTEPLFLPTKWNEYSSKPLLQTQDPLFDSYEPLISPLEPPKLRDEEVQTLNPDPKQVAKIIQRTENSFTGFGRYKSSFKTLPPRSAVIHIHNLSKGGDHMSTFIPEDLIISEESIWKPATFLILKDASASVGLPNLASSTGSEGLDKTLSSYLSTCPAILRLPKGYYEVTVSP